MATTTNFGWETPDDTDYVKDGAAAMRIQVTLQVLQLAQAYQAAAHQAQSQSQTQWLQPSMLKVILLLAQAQMLLAV
jgi:hypothetical protein